MVPTTERIEKHCTARYARGVECVEGHYEVQEVEFGKVYTWRSESVIVECDCGERSSLTHLDTICKRCGADHTLGVQEALDHQGMEEEDAHPWRYAGGREGAGLPC
jgi:hypothetical protein